MRKKTRRLSVFNSVTLDGYFAGTDGDMSWAHSNDDAEWNDFVATNAQGESVMLFGRITYEMMAGWWPTPQAKKSMPIVAERMNSAPKFVFSRTLDYLSWNNATLVKSDLAGTIRQMKHEPGPGIIIFGSGSIVAQLAENGLIDEYQIVLVPVVLGRGRTMFEGIKNKLNLKRTKKRTFANGNTFLCYAPIE